MTKEESCSECPNATHGFDRNASHNLGRYVCECESHECPSETLREKVSAQQEEIVGLYEMNLAQAKTIHAITRQRDLAAEALVHIQQVACSGSPELGISADALSTIKGDALK